MSHELSLREIKKEWHGSYRGYFIGFLASFILTLISFSLVITRALEGSALIYTIVCLAIIQGIVQLIFFLHVGQEPKPRWESLIFYFMVLILVIVVAGSLWIMFDLNSRMGMEM